MNTRSTNTALFCIVVLSVLNINMSASVSTESNEIRSNSHRARSRLLQTVQKEFLGEQDIQEESAPKEIDVDPLSTYNDKFMALMSSPCRPEYDGFFGATSGDPIHIQYGFKVEVEPLSAIMDILDTIEDKIVDSILQSSFPEMCGLHQARKTQESRQPVVDTLKDRNQAIDLVMKTGESDRSLVRAEVHPSGFRFLKFEEVEKCLPEENDVNFCGIFTGVLYVYGKYQQGEENSRAIMSYINRVFDTTNPHDLHSDLTMLSSVDKFSIVQGGNMNQSLDFTGSNSGQISRMAILLIVISSLLTVAALYYAYIQINEQRYHKSKSSVDRFSEGKHKFISKKGDLSINIGSDKEEDSDNDGVFIQDDLRYEPYQDGKQSNGVLL